MAPLDHTSRQEGMEEVMAFLTFPGGSQKCFLVGTVRSICNEMECRSGCFHKRALHAEALHPQNRGSCGTRSGLEPHGICVWALSLCLVSPPGEMG